MTLTTLPAYRRRKVGSQLLEYVLREASKDITIRDIYLHVQTSNVAALDFYKGSGFEQGEMIANYYKNIQPPDCYVLRKENVHVKTSLDPKI
jgi:ribosomal protein S18 acetylase RimI-like enzyme